MEHANKRRRAESPPPPVPMVMDSGVFFPKRGTDTTYEKVWTMSQNLAEVMTDTKLVFNLPSLTSNNFYNLKEAYVTMKIRLEDTTKDDKTPASERICPINNYGVSLFKDVQISLNSVRIDSGATGLNAVQGYLSALFNNTLNRKDGWLSLQGYVEDNWRDYKKVFTHSGAFKRQELLFGTNTYSAEEPSFSFNKQGEYTTLRCPIVSQFTSCEAPLLSGVDVRIEMHRSDLSYNLMMDAGSESKFKEEIGNFRLDIKDPELICPVLTYNPSFNARLEDTLAKSGMMYHTIRLEMTKVPITEGTTNFITTNIKNLSTTPDRIFFMIQPEWAMNSGYGNSPLIFKNRIEPVPPKVEPPPDSLNDDPAPTPAPQPVPKPAAHLKNMRLSLNNESLETSNTMGGAADLAFRKLRDLYTVLGFDDAEMSALSIDVSDFAAQKFICAYDCTRGKNSAKLSPNVRGITTPGQMKLELEFDNPTPAYGWLIIAAEYHSAIQINKSRQVVYKLLT